MAHSHAFDPQAFLAKIGTGRTLVSCQKQHPIFTQGEAADAVFYIQEGQVKLTVVSAQGSQPFALRQLTQLWGHLIRFILHAWRRTRVTAAIAGGSIQRRSRQLRAARECMPR